MVWRPEVQNQGVGRAELPPEAPGENPSCLFQLLELQGFLGCAPPASVSVLTWPSFPLCLWVSFLPLSLIKTPIVRFRAHPGDS